MGYQNTKSLGDVGVKAGRSLELLQQYLKVGEVYGFDWDVSNGSGNSISCLAKKVKVIGFALIKHNESVEAEWLVIGVGQGRPDYDFSSYHASRFTTETIGQIELRINGSPKLKLQEEINKIEKSLVDMKIQLKNM
jgi:hypothetical protein